MKPIWIELVNSGVANRFEFTDHELIEVNWRLTQYPKLYHIILQHEFKHDEGDYQTHDFFHDMTSRTPGLFKFMMDNPSSLTQLLPIYWDRNRKKLVYDISSILSWLMILGLMVGIFYCMRWVW